MAAEKAFLKLETGEELRCLYNPARLSISRGNSWTGTSAPGQGVPQLSYAGASSATMSVELFFDTTDTGTPVTTYTGKLMGLMDIDPSLPGSDPEKNNARPPYVVFHWGRLYSFKAVVTSLTVTFTYVSADGVPLRATVGLQLRQYEASEAFGPQNPTSGTPHPHRVHRVQPGETLDRIAARHYGDATRWRQLAAANRIEDPLALRAGALLAIPGVDS
ncbi:MAG: LysM peptidoglycan-binding domain-containing protein [Kineosporiaceae bacterium]